MPEDTPQTPDERTGAAVQAEKRDSLGRFKPGMSGNPGGRKKGPHSFSQMIRDKVDTEQLIAVAVAIALGQGKRILEAPADGSPPPTVVPISIPTSKDQMKAIEFLVAWGYIKPPTQKQIAIDDGREKSRQAFDPSKLSDKQLNAMDALLEIGAGKSDAQLESEPAIRIIDVTAGPPKPRLLDVVLAPPSTAIEEANKRANDELRGSLSGEGLSYFDKDDPDGS